MVFKTIKNSVLFGKGYEYMISFTYLVLYEKFAKMLPEIVNNNPRNVRE
jgi:hypothetical protein